MSQNKKIRNSLSVIVPAYNEEENLSAAIKNLLKALKNLKNYEIIIFDDHSSDKTGEIADSFAGKNKRIKVVHNKKNRGFGYNCITGFKMASKEYCTIFPGDNENSWESFAEQINLIGKSEIISSYTINTKVRSLTRRLISNAFTKLVNFLFRLNLKYYNGITVYPTKILKHTKVETSGFTFNAEILIKLLKSGYRLTEFGVKINPAKKTNIFRLKNIVSVIWNVCRLFYIINIKRERY